MAEAEDSTPAGLFDVAVREDNPAFVAMALENGGELEAVDPTDNSTVLFRAALGAAHKVVADLLDRGANVHTSYPSPLYAAVEVLCVDTTKVILEKQSSEEDLRRALTLRATNGGTIIAAVCKGDDDDDDDPDGLEYDLGLRSQILDLLLLHAEKASCLEELLMGQDDHGMHPIHFAAGSNYHPLVSTLVKRSRQLATVRDKIGNTPLHHAAFVGSVGAARVIVHADMSAPQVRNNNGQSPMHIAALNDQHEILSAVCDTLIECSAQPSNVHRSWKYQESMSDEDEDDEDDDDEDGDIRARQAATLTDAHGRTPLLAAASVCSLLCISTLIEVIRVSPRETDGRGRNALAYAVTAKKRFSDLYEVVKYLCGHRLQSDQDMQGFSPLHTACYFNNKEAVVALIAEGQRNIEDLSYRSGRNALHAALERPYEVAPVPSSAGEEFESTVSYVAERIDINKADAYGVQPIHIAAGSGRFIALRMLIEKGADVDAVDADGRTPMHYCMMADSPECFEELKAVAKVKAKSLAGYTVLHYAGLFGATRTLETHASFFGKGTVKMMVTSGATQQRVMPHHLAAAKGHVGCLEVFATMSKGILNQRDRLGRLAIHHAMQNGSLKCVEFLVESGCGNVQTPTTKDGTTPLHIAVHFNYDDCIRYCRLHEAKFVTPDRHDRNCLHYAVSGNQWRLIRAITEEEGMSIDMRCSGGMTCLHIAAEKGFERCVEELIKCGADPLAQDAEGRIPLHYAAMTGQGEVFVALAFSGGVDHVDANGRGTLHAAAYGGNSRCIEKAIAFDAAYFRDAAGRTPLHVACMRGHGDAVECLFDDEKLESIRNIDELDNVGMSALHYLAYCDSSSKVLYCLDLLLEEGADVNVVDENGVTPAMLAAFHGRSELKERLLELEEDGEKEDSVGRSVEDYALMGERSRDGEKKESNTTKQARKERLSQSSGGSEVEEAAEKAAEDVRRAEEEAEAARKAQEEAEAARKAEEEAKAARKAEEEAEAARKAAATARKAEEEAEAARKAEEAARKAEEEAEAEEKAKDAQEDEEEDWDAEIEAEEQAAEQLAARSNEEEEDWDAEIEAEEQAAEQQAARSNEEEKDWDAEIEAEEHAAEQLAARSDEEEEDWDAEIEAEEQAAEQQAAGSDEEEKDWDAEIEAEEQAAEQLAARSDEEEEDWDAEIETEERESAGQADAAGTATQEEEEEKEEEDWDAEIEADESAAITARDGDQEEEEDWDAEIEAEEAKADAGEEEDWDAEIASEEDADASELTKRQEAALQNAMEALARAGDTSPFKNPFKTASGESAGAATDVTGPGSDSEEDWDAEIAAEEDKGTDEATGADLSEEAKRRQEIAVKNTLEVLRRAGQSPSQFSNPFSSGAASGAKQPPAQERKSWDAAKDSGVAPSSGLGREHNGRAGTPTITLPVRSPNRHPASAERVHHISPGARGVGVDVRAEVDKLHELFTALEGRIEVLSKHESELKTELMRVQHTHNLELEKLAGTPIGDGAVDAVVSQPFRLGRGSSLAKSIALRVLLGIGVFLLLAYLSSQREWSAQLPGDFLPV